MKGNDEAVLQELNTEWTRSAGWVVGFDIVDRIQAQKAIGRWTKFWSGRGSVYVILHRLANDGLVESQVMGAERSPGWPDRKEYQITDKGRHEYGAWLDRGKA